MVTFCDSARHDANHTWMPIFLSHNNCGLFLPPVVADLLVRRSGDLSFQAVATFIQLVDVLGQGRRPRQRVGGQ